MITEVLPITEESLKKAREIILSGGVVAFPTETVYGLGANALDEEAVKKIFEAKGRPSDNPLIVHVAEKSAIEPLVKEILPDAKKVINKFMPGPITVVMPKSKIVPDKVTAGGKTVGVRIPESTAARQFLAAVGVPIAAPSANTSSRPSPTSAKHVFEDLNGKIPLILDGGECSGGVESTVVSINESEAMLLRPGLVTLEELSQVLKKVTVHPSVLADGKVDAAASPGMKYKHYSPVARVVIVNDDILFAKQAYAYIKSLGKKPVLLWQEDKNIKDEMYYCFFAQNDKALAAKNLFALLRRADSEGFDVVLAQGLDISGEGLSVMNRLLRAAAFTVIDKNTTKEEINRIL